MGFLKNIIFRQSTTAPAESRSTKPQDVSALVTKALQEFDLAFDSNEIQIDEKSSLAISAVWACVRIISESVATLPLHLKRRTENGRETVRDHAVCSLLNQPSPIMNGIDLREALMVSVVLWGNGYAHISQRDKFYRPLRLDFIPPQSITIIEGQDDLYYRINSGVLIPSRDMIHTKGLTTNGIEGISPIRRHRENLQLTMQAQRFGINFFKNGCHSTGVFESDTQYSQEAYDRLKEQLFEKYVGLTNSAKPLLLEGGLKFNKITIPPEDAQFIATRKFQKTEIATIFGVPPHMIADLDRSTNNNIEHQGIEFVQYCLMPYIVKMEAEFNNKLLREDEKTDHYIRYEFNGLLRSDAKTRSEYYGNMNRIGAMNANEIRAKEDINAYDGGEHYFVQANMKPVSQAFNNQLTNPNNE